MAQSSFSGFSSQKNSKLGKYYPTQSITDSDISNTTRGTQLWYSTITGSARGVALDYLGNIYACYYNGVGSKVVVKFNSNGTEAWSLTDIGLATSIAVDRDLNVYVTYNKNSGTKSVRKLNSSGTEIWSLADVSSPNNIALDSDLNLYVTYTNPSGSKNIRKLNSSGGEIWSRTDIGNANCVAIYDNNNIYVTYGVSTASGANIRKIDSSGNIVWSKVDYAYPNSVIVDDTNNIYITYENTIGSRTIRKLNLDGVEINYSVLFPLAMRSCLDKKGNIYIVCNTTSYGFSIIKTNSEMSMIWALYGLESILNARDIHIDNDGYLYIAGDSSITGKSLLKIDPNIYYKLK